MHIIMSLNALNHVRVVGLLDLAIIMDEVGKFIYYVTRENQICKSKP